MMKTSIFIPNRINVGFQNRTDTYTGKLAYVIYYDEKGVLRKSGSWSSWRDKDIPNEEFDNVPTEGFVLNKKVGDYHGDWDGRKCYCRIYDPRGFEFEITVDNLLYILENTTSTKGKGFEGEFVYGWDGKDLVLVPIDSPDYKQCKEFSDNVKENNNIKSSDLIVGAHYLHKNGTEYVYMGRFDKYDWFGVDIGKYYWFFYKSEYGNDEVETWKSFPKNAFVKQLTDTCDENYAGMYEYMTHRVDFSPLDDSLNTYSKIDKDAFVNWFTNDDNKYRNRYVLDESQTFLCEITKLGNGSIRVKKREYSNDLHGTYLSYSWGHTASYSFTQDEIKNLYSEYKSGITQVNPYEIAFTNVLDVYDYIKPHYRVRYQHNGNVYTTSETFKKGDICRD